MSLKTATNIAIAGLVVNLILALFQNAIFQFDLIDYTENMAFIRTLGYIQIIVLNVSLIIFFVVLKSKQK